MDNFLEELPKLPTPGQMGEWDKAAVEFGLPGSLLMENAGLAIFNSILDEYGKDACKNVALFMGKGNNGGDAVCIGRHLRDMGANALIFHLAPLETCKGPTAWEVDLAKADGLVFEQIDENFSDNVAVDHFFTAFYAHFGQTPRILVDGLLGTGFGGQLRPRLRAIIENINRLKEYGHCATVAVDIPSGLDGLTGKPCPIAIRADLTVSLAAAKTGLLQAGARQYTGKLVARGIGFPGATASGNKAEMRLLDGRSLLERPKAISQSYKNIYGHLFVIGGAGGLSGAAHCAAAAALRAGAGLVTACAPPSSRELIKNGWPEIMTFALGQGENWPENLPPAFARKLEQADALVIGPGMGRDEDSVKFLRALLALSHRPLAVFDADALTILAGNPQMLDQITANDIFTPHPGEAAALLGLSSAEIQADRKAAMQKLCELAPAAIILKGAFTMISQKGRDIIICPYDIPQMAIGGAGDVLSGIVGALLASKNSGCDSLALACKAVIIHVVAGMILALKYPQRGGVAGELVDAISRVYEFVAELPKSALEEGVMPWPDFC